MYEERREDVGFLSRLVEYAPVVILEPYSTSNSRLNSSKDIRAAHAHPRSPVEPQQLVPSEDEESASPPLPKPMSGEPTHETESPSEVLEEKAKIKRTGAVAAQAEDKGQAAHPVELSRRQLHPVYTVCTKPAGTCVNSLLDAASSPHVVNYSNSPPVDPVKEPVENSRPSDSSTNIWYPKSAESHSRKSLDFQNEDSPATERFVTVGKTDTNLDERSFNSSPYSTETEPNVLNFNENSKHEDTLSANISRGVACANAVTKNVLNITKELASNAHRIEAAVRTKCNENLPSEQNLITSVDKPKLPDTRNDTRLEGRTVVNYPNKDLINYGCHPGNERLLLSNNCASDNKCSGKTVDIESKAHGNSLTASEQISGAFPTANTSSRDVHLNKQLASTIVIVTESIDYVGMLPNNNENDTNLDPDKKISQLDCEGGDSTKKYERHDDVICDKQHAENREPCDADVLISNNQRPDSVGHSNDSNDDLLEAHGILAATPNRVETQRANNSHLSEIMTKREETPMSKRYEKSRAPYCDKSENSNELLNHTCGLPAGAKIEAKETIVNNNTRISGFQKNGIGFLRPFIGHKKEKGMRACKSLVFDKMESEDLLRNKDMTGSYGNVRKPTILPFGNQRKRCVSTCCESENKRYMALSNNFEDVSDEQGPNSPMNSSKKAISLSTITLTKLRNNNQKIYRKIDTILSKSWKSLLSVPNARSPDVSTPDMSDGARVKPFYKNQYGTRSVLNVNSNIIYKQPAYSKSWTEISAHVNEPRQKSSGHYASNVCRQGAAPLATLPSSSSDEAVRETSVSHLAKLRELSSSSSSVSGEFRSGSFSSEPLKPVNRLRVPSLCEDGIPSKVCSRCSSLLSVACSSKYSVSSLVGFVSVPEVAAHAEPVASASGGAASGVVLCKVCLLEVPYGDSWTLSDCHCSYCLECVLQYVDFEIGQGAYQISCPDAACESQGLITLAEIETLMSAEAFEKHKRFRLNKEVDLDKSRTWCPYPGCDTICSLRGDRSAPQPVTCVTCAHEFCSLCRDPWHQGAPCNRSPSGGATFDSELIKCCPMCSVPIEKDEGCAQMLCKRCKHVFCWYCLASLDDDFLLRHYDKGPCKNKLGHSRASVIWHRTQVIGIFAGFGILLLVASPLLLLAAPCIVCCKCHVCTSGDSEEDLPLDLPGLGEEEGGAPSPSPSPTGLPDTEETPGVVPSSNGAVSSSEATSSK